jgi:queuine/archaeosine tRNA-ribosyltransferase
MLDFTRRIRRAVSVGGFSSFKKEFLNRYSAGRPTRSAVPEEIL